jgi:hypothetical protein
MESMWLLDKCADHPASGLFRSSSLCSHCPSVKGLEVALNGGTSHRCIESSEGRWLYGVWPPVTAVFGLEMAELAEAARERKKEAEGAQIGAFEFKTGCLLKVELDQFVLFGSGLCSL